MLTWSRMLRCRKAPTNRVVHGFFPQADRGFGRYGTGSAVAASPTDKHAMPCGTGRDIGAASNSRRSTGQDRRDGLHKVAHRSDLTLSVLLDDGLQASPGEGLRSRELSRFMECEESPC